MKTILLVNFWISIGFLLIKNYDNVDYDVAD